MCGLKGRERAVEKARLDYAGNCARLTDLLRGCVICPSDEEKQMENILSCHKVMDQLALDGEISIAEITSKIKNRIRDGATSTGYVDMNFRIMFHGHMCEFQILDRVMFDLKNEAHSSYELCRSFGLVGPMQRVSTRRASTVMRAVPLAERLTLGFLRFLVGVLGALMAMLYLSFLLGSPGTSILLPDEPLVFKLVLGFALAAPFSITSFLACGDLIEGASRGSRAAPCGIVVVGCGMLVGFGAATGDPGLFGLFCMVAFIYLLHFAAAATAMRWRGCGGACGAGRGGGPSRAAMLYRRYFGINGTLTQSGGAAALDGRAAGDGQG
jgi:hypothetical protein